MPDTLEGYDGEFDESLDEGFDAEYEEAYRPSRLRLARPAPAPTRPPDRPVTQAQLQMAVNRLDGYINRNSTAIAKVNTGVAALGKDVRRQRAELNAVRKDVSTARDAIILLPLLQGIVKDSPLAALFPILLLGGMGGGDSGSRGGGLFGGGDDSMMMLVLVMALSGGLKSS